MMSQRVEFKDGRVVVLEDPKSYDSAIEEHAPCAVLLSSSDEHSDLSCLVASAVSKGCRNFTCIGPDSESLHDAIDDVLFSAEIEEGVITTWHADDSVEDISNYFVNIAGECKEGKAVSLALIADEMSFNQQIWQAILTIADEG
ncbi:MAG: hypothetical protein AAGB19_16465 [Cyanobacteria bacterium P01_F01_bin.3]